MKGVEALREREIRKKVREQLVYHLTQDLEGDEALFKEVFEDCDTQAELAVANSEIRFLRNTIRDNKL